MEIAVMFQQMERIIAFLKREADRWDRIACRHENGDPTDEEVKSQMSGHAMWDDPPQDWTERELLLWSRGYLWAESAQLGNAAATIHAAIDMDGGLKCIAKQLLEHKGELNGKAP